MSESSDSPLKILIVESDRIVARDIELTLQRNGYEVTAAPFSVEDVYQDAEDNQPDLAVVSVEFQGGGVAIAQKLRDVHRVPVIFITGRDGDNVFEDARGARPVGYVRKPFSGAELISSIEAAAQRIDPDRLLTDKLPWIRSVAETVEESVIVAGMDGRVVLMNQSAESLTGWLENEASGALYSQVAPTSHSLREKAKVNGGSNELGSQCLITDRKGNQHSVRAITTPIRDERTELLGTITILKNKVGEPSTLDLDGLTAAEISNPQRLRALDSLSAIDVASINSPISEISSENVRGFARLLDQIGDPLFVFDRELTVLQANTEAIKVFGSEDDEVLGRGFTDLFSSREVNRYEEDFFAPLYDGKSHQLEFHDTHRATWFDVRLYRSYEGVIALFHDITAKRISEADAVRRHRLEGLGLLARGFAHDFNNQLTAVSGNISLVKEIEEDPELIEMLSEAEVASNRAADLVQQLMTFATGGRPVREPVKVPDLLRQILSEHRMGKPSIRFQFQCAEKDLRANIDRAQTRRVIENLISNAEESMLDGGMLSLDCTVINGDKAKALNGVDFMVEEDHLLIEVIDTGCGMDEDTLSKALEPYFTRRFKENASGIGLTVCESIAKAHDGFVVLESEVDKGTTASFCMPLGLKNGFVEWEAVTVADSAPMSLETSLELPSDFDRSDYRILILEDDGQIRRLMTATLKRAGYHVVETAEGAETLSAFRRAQEKGEPFDLVISDLTIEYGMGGVETMRKLKEMDKNILAIVSSGYSDAAAMANPTAFGFKGVIPKPYSPHILKDEVDQLILKHGLK